MEPDEKHIQEKLKRWESEAPPVDTDRLWNDRITIPTARRNRSYVFYYTAASLLLAGALIYHGFTRYQATKMELQLKEAELALANVIEPQVTEPTTRVESPCPEQPAVNPSTQLRRVRKASVQEPSSASLPSQQIEQRTAVARIESPESIETADPVISEPPVKTVSPKPRVILGRRSGETETSTSSRFRLVILRSEGSDERSNKPQPVTLAGINN